MPQGDQAYDARHDHCNFIDVVLLDTGNRERKNTIPDGSISRSYIEFAAQQEHDTSSRHDRWN